MSSVAAAAPAISLEALNPIDALLGTFNSNPYFIGVMMLALNLGGRFLAMEVTKEQEKFFQNSWVRGLLIFVVVFVATRNILVAFWLSLAVLLLVRFLFNEHSPFYILRMEKARDKKEAGAILTPEEADIYRKLTDKMAKAQSTYVEPTEEATYDIHATYNKNISSLKFF